MTGIKDLLRSRFPVLESERLILRRLEPQDADALHRCMMDPAVSSFTAIRPGKLLFPDRLYRYFEETYQSLRDLHFAVECKAEGRLAGLCSLQDWTPDGKKARLGYLLSPAYWNRGYATEAVQSVLAYGFGTLGLARVEARCRADNPASERVLQKCGLRYAGPLPLGSRQGDAKPQTLKLYFAEGEPFET